MAIKYKYEDETTGIIIEEAYYTISLMEVSKKDIRISVDVKAKCDTKTIKTLAFTFPIEEIPSNLQEYCYEELKKVFPNAIDC